MSTSVRFLGLAFAVLATAASVQARAEVGLLRIGRGPGFSFLPAYILQHEKFFEQRARELGLGDIRVEYDEVSGGNVMNGALLAGDMEIALGGVPPFLILWARSQGTRQEVKALAAVSALPSVLLSRNPTVKSLHDITSSDRISVAAARASQVAVLLEMASAQTFGRDEWARLDRQTVSLPQPESVAAMLSNGGEITAHFTVPPYSYIELKSPNIHVVLHSRDVLGGVGTVVVAYATSRFHDENPKTMEAVFKALQDASDFVRTRARETAEIYLSMSREPLTVSELEQLMRDPDLSYDVTPAATMKFADFMFQTHSLPRKPERWQDLFFPEAHGLHGS
jgi:NitT/TauT family transport system substrate-binding protein